MIGARPADWCIGLELGVALAELLHILQQMLPGVFLQATLLLLIEVHHMTLAEALLRLSFCRVDPALLVLPHCLTRGGISIIFFLASILSLY